MELKDLQTCYGLEDLHDILEVISVDRLNEQMAAGIMKAMRKAEADAAKVR